MSYYFEIQTDHLDQDVIFSPVNMNTIQIRKCRASKKLENKTERIKLKEKKI